MKRLALALLIASTPAWADSPECRRFHRDPGLTPLCERLMTAASAGPLTAEDNALSTLLGNYLAAVGYRELMHMLMAYPPVTDTARYLIARETGLHAAAGVRGGVEVAGE